MVGGGEGGGRCFFVFSSVVAGFWRQARQVLNSACVAASPSVPHKKNRALKPTLRAGNSRHLKPLKVPAGPWPPPPWPGSWPEEPRTGCWPHSAGWRVHCLHPGACQSSAKQQLAALLDPTCKTRASTNWPRPLASSGGPGSCPLGSRVWVRAVSSDSPPRPPRGPSCDSRRLVGLGPACGASAAGPGRHP